MIDRKVEAINRLTLMNAGIVAAVIYGFLSIFGGIIGYAQARSKVSLTSGLISGLLLILGGTLRFFDIPGGLVLAAIVSAALIAVFAYRLYKTRKFMPAGVMIIAGVITLVVIVLAR